MAIFTQVLLFFVVGIAPLHAADYNTTDQNDLEKECTTGRCMGPIGLDFGLENVPQEQQIHAFEEQVMTQKSFSSLYLYLHFHCESLNEPLHLRCGSYLHEQIDFSHTHIRAI